MFMFNFSFLVTHKPCLDYSFTAPQPVHSSRRGASSNTPAKNFDPANRKSDTEVDHFSLNIQKISGGYDTRTTLMLKNIPNKYTQKTLLATIDESHRYFGCFSFNYS